QIVCMRFTSQLILSAADNSVYLISCQLNSMDSSFVFIFRGANRTQLFSLNSVNTSSKNALYSILREKYYLRVTVLSFKLPAMRREFVVQLDCSCDNLVVRNVGI